MNEKLTKIKKTISDNAYEILVMGGTVVATYGLLYFLLDINKTTLVLRTSDLKRITKYGGVVVFDSKFGEVWLVGPDSIREVLSH